MTSLTRRKEKAARWSPGLAKHEDSGRKSTANKNIISDDDLALMLSHLAFLKCLDLKGAI